MPFDVTALFGHPFFAATLALAIFGWIIAFISCCVAATHSFLPGYSWFALFFELVLLVGIIAAIGSDGIHNYRFVILTFLAVGIILTTLAVEDNVYFHISSNSGVAAGMILLAASNFLFVFVFGSEENTIVSRSINGLAVPRSGAGFGSSQPSAGNTFGIGNKSANTNNHTVSSRNDGALAAGAVSAPVSGGAPPAHAPSSAGGAGLASPTSPPPSAAPGSATGAAAGATTSPAPDTYTYQAKALYSYEANPSDPNELSFNKGDILSIVDNSGKWWQARRADGSVGIVPSNYLSLL